MSCPVRPGLSLQAFQDPRRGQALGRRGMFFRLMGSQLGGCGWRQGPEQGFLELLDATRLKAPLTQKSPELSSRSPRGLA